MKKYLTSIALLINIFSFAQSSNEQLPSIKSIPSSVEKGLKLPPSKAPITAVKGGALGDLIATTEENKKVRLKKNGTWEYITSIENNSNNTLIKKLTEKGDLYSISQVVMIENGRGEKVEVTFNTLVPKQIWDDLVSKRNNEAEFFELIARMLSINAQYSLKNHLSFQPFSKQFFMYDKGVFMSMYKMSGKNGYGNSVETEELVKYDPLEK